MPGVCKGAVAEGPVLTDKMEPAAGSIFKGLRAETPGRVVRADVYPGK